MAFYIQDDPGEKVNILGGHSVGHSKQKIVHVRRKLISFWLCKENNKLRD
jgi:hypothetical protein